MLGGTAALPSLADGTTYRLRTSRHGLAAPHEPRPAGRAVPGTCSEPALAQGSTEALGYHNDDMVLGTPRCRRARICGAPRSRQAGERPGIGRPGPPGWPLRGRQMWLSAHGRPRTWPTPIPASTGTVARAAAALGRRDGVLRPTRPGDWRGVRGDVRRGTGPAASRRRGAGMAGGKGHLGEHRHPAPGGYAGWRLAERLLDAGRRKDAEDGAGCRLPAAEGHVPLRTRDRGSRPPRTAVPPSDTDVDSQLGRPRLGTSRSTASPPASSTSCDCWHRGYQRRDRSAAVHEPEDGERARERDHPETGRYRSGTGGDGGRADGRSLPGGAGPQRLITPRCCPARRAATSGGSTGRLTHR